MQNQPEKRIPTKYQPRGLEILFEDRDIIVVNKASGLLTMGTEREKQNTAYFILTDYVRKGNSRSSNRIFIVHRLDRDTSGILVFAKTEQAKRFLQENWKEFSKKYIAIVHGNFADKESEIISYLVENKMGRMYSVKNPEKGKFSKTGYRVISENKSFSMLEISLFTGTKNQIRVQFAENGHPVAGDKTYGIPEKSIKRLMLHSLSLTILHPFTKKPVTFKTEIPAYFSQVIK